jgi:DNA-binding CsgD family transcriptional regulator
LTASDSVNSLTEKEKETLRLVVRGHDAKSAANEIGLSAHTINERLRSARRKLGATSSWEAARILFECEAACKPQDPQNSVYTPMGEAAEPGTSHRSPTIRARHGGGAEAGLNPALWNGGGVTVSILAMVLALSLAQDQTEPNRVQVEQTQTVTRSAGTDVSDAGRET